MSKLKKWHVVTDYKKHPSYKYTDEGKRRERDERTRLSGKNSKIPRK